MKTIQQEISDTLKKYDVPRNTVARLSGMHLSDLSGWLNGRQDLSQDKIERVTQVVSDIEKVVTVMPCKLDLRDPENVRRLIVAVNDAAMQLDLAYAQEPPEASGTAA